jgi:hypothetical protein
MVSSLVSDLYFFPWEEYYIHCRAMLGPRFPLSTTFCPWSTEVIAACLPASFHVALYSIVTVKIAWHKLCCFGREFYPFTSQVSGHFGK